MKTAAKIIISSVLFLGCDGQETDSSCGPKNSGIAMSKQELGLLAKPPVVRLRHSNIVMVLSGDKTQKMTLCSGVIVGHNAVLTAASCLKGDVDVIYVVPGRRISTQIGTQIDTNAADMQNKLIDMAVKPKKVSSHGTISTSATIVEASKRPDDLAVLLLADKTFRIEDYDKSLIGSVYDGYPRPKIGQFAVTVGFGTEKSNVVDRREKRGMYAYDSAVLKDLLFYHDRETSGPGSNVRFNRFQKTFEADKGAPLLTSLEGTTGEFMLDFIQANIVGLLVHQESIKAIDPFPPFIPTGASSPPILKDPDPLRSIYVDLYNERSVGLLKKAANDGANFLQPFELYKSNLSRGNDVIRPKRQADCQPNRPN
jgi:hypothetical protein